MTKENKYRWKRDKKFKEKKKRKADKLKPYYFDKDLCPNFNIESYDKRGNYKQY